MSSHTVNIFDLVVVAHEFGRASADNAATDVNGDAIVNIFDLVWLRLTSVNNTARPLCLYLPIGHTPSRGLTLNGSLGNMSAYRLLFHHRPNSAEGRPGGTEAKS